MKIFGQVQNLVVAHTDVSADAGEPYGSSFQISHPDNIVINHSIGNIFCRSDRQSISPVCTPVYNVILDNRLKALKIFSDIVNVLKISDIVTPRKRHRLNDLWQLDTPCYKLLPVSLLQLRASDSVLGNLYLSGGVLKLRLCLARGGKRNVKGFEAGLYTTTGSPYGFLKTISRKRQHSGARQCTKQTGRDHTARIHGNLLHVKRDIAF